MRNKIFLVLILICILSCAKAASVKKEDLAQDFTLSTIDGANISLSDYKGKKSVLVVFWATWCPYCVEEIPALNKMKGKYYDGIEILGINIKESPEKVGNFVKERNMKYTILLDSAGEVARKYGVSGIPMNILIDRDWKIIYKGHSIEECEESWQRQLQR